MCEGQVNGVCGCELTVWTCRLARPPAKSIAALNSTPHTAVPELQPHDQLHQGMQQRTGHPLAAFSEGLESAPLPPMFKPTYKMVCNSEQYDQKRAPAWTDRILWRCNYAHAAPAAQQAHLPSMRPLWYDAVQGLTISDHKPVAAAFDVRLKHAAEVVSDTTVDHAAYFTVQQNRSRKQQWFGGSGSRPSMRRAPSTALLPLAAGPLQSNARAVLSMHEEQGV